MSHYFFIRIENKQLATVRPAKLGVEVWEEIKVLNVSNTKFAKNLVLELKSGAAQQWIQERYEVCNYESRNPLSKSTLTASSSSLDTYMIISP